MTPKVRLSHGLRQLLADDPCSFLLYAVEQVQEQAHHRRLGRVLRRLQRRKHELGWVHVSDLGNPCDRVLAARLLGYQLPRERIDPKLSRIFENGTYMHLRFYNYFLSLPPPFEVQVAAVLRKWPIIGEADVIVQHPELGQQIIELKSINTDQFKLLKRPHDGHIDQLNGYLGLANNGVSGQVWYENKNTQDIKAFPLEFDSELFEDSYNRILDLVAAVLRGELPKACGTCNLDEYVASLEGVEQKMARLARLAETR